LDAVTLPESDKRVGGSRDTRQHAIAVSPDGRLLATLDLGGTIHVWNAATRKVLHSFPAASGQCNLAFSPDGQWLSTGGYRGQLALWEARTGQQVLKLAGHPARVFWVGFSPDGRTLLSGSDDNTCLLWDLRPKTEGKDVPEPAALWEALVGADGPAAYRAVWLLADRPAQTVPFLKGKLTPAKPIDPGRLRSVLDRLDSDRFADREAATKELAAWGGVIESDLRRELTQAPSAEKSRRLQAVLDGLAATIAPEDVRQARAVVALKWAKTPEARKLLEELAAGAPGARLTAEAREALRFLTRP
jgi:hypothetical protein